MARQDEVYNCWVKIAKEFDSRLGGLSDEDTRPRQGDGKLTLMKKTLNSLNRGALSL